MDFGGAYGRNWEKNQERDFEDEPCARLEVWGAEDFYIYVSTYHWLRGRLEYDEKIDQEFQEFAKDRDESWLTLMEDFFDEVLGFDYATVNTYNHESVLDQVIQYTHAPEEGIVLLQIHGGCDVRGGYTRPRAFRDEWDYIYYDADCGLNCKECDASWYSDDAGYHFYAGYGDPADFGDYDHILVDNVGDHNLVIHEGFVTHKSMLQDNLPGIDRVEAPGKVVFDPDNNTIYCPECGSALVPDGRCEV